MDESKQNPPPSNNARDEPLDGQNIASGGESPDEKVDESFRQTGRVLRSAEDTDVSRTVSAGMVFDSSGDLQDKASRVDDVPLPEVLGDFSIERKLGQGGMGIVYQAKHVVSGDVFALKLLPNLDADRLYRFKRESRSMRDVKHPNLVAIHDLVEFKNQWFFTMDLVEDGQTFLEYVRPGGVVNLQRVLHAFAQLVEGVHVLHQHGVLHRDLKPSNVLVEPGGRVVILDFGLVSEMARRNQTLSVESVSGTPAYLAPESAANGDETFACDWYAVGVMLYEALSGSLPFRGSIAQMLMAKQAKDAPQFEAPDDVPDELITLTMGLLARDPQQRPTYEEIATVFGHATESNRNLPPREELLGREEQLAELSSLLQRCRSEEVALVGMVAGRSGEGKSALIEEFLHGLNEQADVVVLQGRCYDQECVPYKALDSVIDALASYLRRIDSVRAAALLPDDTGFLASLFPVLNRVEAVSVRRTPNLKNLDATQIRERAYAALRSLLYRLSENATILLVIDDLHWGDAASAEAVHAVIKGSEPPRLLFIGGYRSDEASTSSFLTNWESLRQDKGHPHEQVIEVGPLTHAQCRSLVEDYFAGRQENLGSLVDRLYEETAGNAFLLKELLDCVRATGTKLERIPLREVIQQKLARLPEGSEAVLQAIAVAGKQVSTDIIQQVAESSRSLSVILNQMRSERLVRFLDAGEERLVDTYHDKVRETTLSMLEEQQRGLVHQRFAVVLKENCSINLDALVQDVLRGHAATECTLDSVFDIAEHARAVGLDEESAALTLLAAEQARSRHAQDVASELYAVADESLKAGMLQIAAFRVLEGYASCLMRMGDYQKAEAALEDARNRGFGRLRDLRILQLSADVAFRDARMDESIHYSSEVIQACGVNAPKSPLGRWLKSLIEGGKDLLRDRRDDRREQRPAKQEETFLLHACGSLNMTSAFSRGDSFFWPIWAGLNRSRDIQPNGSMAFAIAMNSAVWSLIGFTRRGDRLRRRTVEVLSHLNDHLAASIALSLIAYGGMSRGDLKLALEQSAKAVDEAVAAGDKWYRNFSQLHGAMTEYFAGRLEECAISCSEILSRCAGNIDTRNNCAYYVAQRLAGDDFRLDLDPCQLTQRPSDILSTCNLHKGLALAALRDGNFDEAISYLEQACWLPVKVRIPHVYVYSGFPLLAMALRRKAMAIQEEHPAEAKKLLKRAAKIMGRARWVARWMRSELPFTLREYGLARAALGQFKPALRILQQSCSVAEELGEKYELSVSKQALAQLQVEQGIAGAEARLQEANIELHRFRELIASGFLRAGIAAEPILQSDH